MQHTLPRCRRLSQCLAELGVEAVQGLAQGGGAGGPFDFGGGQDAHHPALLSPLGEFGAEPGPANEVLEQRVNLKKPFQVATRAAFDAWLKAEGLHNLKRSRRGARVREILRERGLDGMVIEGDLEGGRNSGRVFVAFDKEQAVTVNQP